MSTSHARTAAVAGAVGGLAGLGVAELGSGLLHMRVSPVLAVGESIIEITPGGVAERLVQAVGQWDKPLLVSGVLLGLVVGSAVAGWLMWRRQIVGTMVFLALGAVAVVAVATRSDSGQWDPVVPFLGTAVALVVTTQLIDRFVNVRAADDADDGRRQFLVAVGVLATAAVVAGGVGRWLAGARSSVESARSRLRLPIRRPETPPGTEIGVDGIASWVSDNETFYRIDTALAPPLVRPHNWQLRIHGMVEREVTLTYDDLVARGLTDAWVTLCCVSNEVGGSLIGNARWSGIRTADLLAEAGPTDEADALLSTSDDGWTCGTPLSVLTDDRDAMLAVAMNGEPLPVEHGFPVRMVVPGLYGFVSATKWVVDWEVTRFDAFDAYWTTRGWSEQAEIKTQSRIDVPRGGADLSAGTVRVGGVAWAQHRGIERVEVRVDEGEWEPATLARVPSVDTWVQWVWEWGAPSGDHTLQVRATDRDGTTQSGDEVDPVPDGAEGWHTVSVTVS